MPVLIATTIGFSVSLFILAAFRSQTGPTAERRLGLAASTPRDPLSESFVRRILQPIITRAASVLTVILPGRVLGRTRDYLEMAGTPIPLRSFLTIWAFMGLVVPLLLTMALIARGSLSGGVLLAPLVWMAAGTYLPWLWLKRRAASRARSIQRQLPDAIDLIITNIEAGLGLQAALLAVSDRMAGPVAEEFGRAVREISVGRDRTDVFDAMARRSGVLEMRLFARAVAQAERTGFPIAKVLRNHASEIRERRRQVAREKAAKVPVKILFPTVMFMFPTLFIVILTPVAIDALARF